MRLVEPYRPQPTGSARTRGSPPGCPIVQTFRQHRCSAYTAPIFAPEDEGYRASLAVAKTELDPPTGEHFETLMEHLYHAGGLDLDGYQLIDAKGIDVEGALAHLAHYEWTSTELGSRVTQVDAMIMGTGGTFHKIHCYSLKRLEVRYVPLFLHMISAVTSTVD